MTHRGDFYPLKPELAEMVERAESLRDRGSVTKWLFKGKEDISPELTPKLFPSGAEAVKGEGEVEDIE
jgi:hypothetical protein